MPLATLLTHSWTFTTWHDMHLKPTQLDGWILYTSSSQLRAEQAPSTPEGSLLI